MIERIAALFVFILGIGGYVVGSLSAIHINGGRTAIAFTAATCYGSASGCS